MSTTSYNIPERIEMHDLLFNICLVKKFDCDQTSYNKIQHDTTRYNKVAKRVQHFIRHKSCMMLYEMLYSFGLHISRKDHKHIFANMFFKLPKYGL